MLPLCSVLLAAAVLGGDIGIEVMSRPSPFVDLAKESRHFTKIDGTTPAPADTNGWPMSDGQVVLFDYRPIKAWAPPADDPAGFQPDTAGVYRLSFTGQAQVGNAGAGSITISDQHYDRATNRSTFLVALAKGSPAMLCLRFGQTRRTPGAATGSGITGLRCIRPGYSPDTLQIFDAAFLDALRPFQYLRFMVWLGTNEAGGKAIRWEGRTVPSDATQDRISWEYVIAIANALDKNIWINIPAAATGDDPKDETSYIYQLARMLKRDLKPGIAIYLEYSNELWYDRFPQYAWNRDAAAAEVGRGKSLLNNDGVRDPGVWMRRRGAKRLYEAAKIFDGVFGSAVRIRPVYAWWYQQPEQFRDVLAWMNKTYGPPRNYFWGIAQSDYFYDAGANGTTTVPQILAIMRADSDTGVRYTRQVHAVAVEFGLHHTCYEGGPDNSDNSGANPGTRILANRADEMGRLIDRHVRTNWFPYGPDSFTYFGLSGPYAAFGSWGATEDYRDTRSPKFKALAGLAASGQTRK